MDFRSDLSPSSDLEAAVGRGLAAMGATDATVRVVNDFQAVVAGLTGIPEYSPERTGGTVAGKTITTTEGEVVILKRPRFFAAPMRGAALG